MLINELLIKKSSVPVIVKIKFDKEHFEKLIVKLNTFYKDNVLLQVLKKEKYFFSLKNVLCFQIKNNEVQYLKQYKYNDSLHERSYDFFYLTTD